MVEKILSQSAFWLVNKAVAKAVGIEGALMLSDLVDKKQYFENKGQLDADGFFFNTSADIEEHTTLTYHIQKQALKLLKQHGFVDTKLKGLPAKLHFKIDENKILNFLITGVPQTEKPVQEEVELSNNNKGNNSKVKNNGSEGETPSLFKPGEVPSIPDPKTRKSMFENSDLYKDQVKFDTVFKEEIALGVDVEYYRLRVLNWNHKKETKRTSRGWAATMRDFMATDNEDNKLKFVDGRQQSKTNVQDQLDYLNM